MAASWSWAADSKLCFVTTGATAPFTELIAAVLSPACLDALISSGFTHLLVQYGSAADVFKRSLSTAQSHLQQIKSGLIIDGMDFDYSNGLSAQFRLVQQSKGLLISHAGTFHILSYTVTTH
jgi:beta-1,4-N-acetylglucosaminyltransferase